MSQSLPLLTLTRTASGTVSAETFVDATGATATASAAALGVARTNALDGKDLPVDVLGTTTVIASGAISDGADLEVAAEGKAVVLSTGVRVAIALQDAVDGQAFEALLVK